MSENISSIDQFAHAYEQRIVLADKLSTAPEPVRDLLEQGLSAADARIAELASQPEVREHYVGLGEQLVKASAELEETAPMLTELGLGAQVEAKRQELEARRRDPKIKASNYFFEQPKASGVGVTYVPVAEKTAESPTAASAAKAPETEKPQKPFLRIIVDPNNNISVNGRSISLSREVQAAGSRTNMAYGRELRVKALRFLAEHQGSMFMRGPIAEAVGLDITSREGKTAWYTHVQPFLEESPSFDRTPIIHADTSIVKRYTYGITDFEVSIGDTDQIMRPKNETIFTMPDGEEIGGKTGRFLVLLARASRERPVRTEDICGRNKIYTPEEIAEQDLATRQLLSGLAAQARKRVEGTAYVVKHVVLDEEDPETHRKLWGFYMLEDAELAADDAARRAAIHARGRYTEAASTPTPAALAETPAEAEEQIEEAIATDEPVIVPEVNVSLKEFDSSDPLTIREATVLAHFLVMSNDLLEKNGLKAFPVELADKIHEQALTGCSLSTLSSKELTILRKQAFDKVKYLLAEDDRLLTAAEAFDASEDSRGTFLLELTAYSKKEHADFIVKLMDTQPKLEIVEGKIGGARWEGAYVQSIAGQSVSTNGETYARQSSAERPRREDPAWLKDFKHAIGETISQFEADGLMEGREVDPKIAKMRSSSASMGTDTMFERAITNGILSRKEAAQDRISIAKLVCMALQNSNGNLFTSRSRRRQALAAAEQAVDRYFAKREQ